MILISNFGFGNGILTLAVFGFMFATHTSCGANRVKSIHQSHRIRLPGTSRVAEVSRDGGTAAVGAGRKLVVLDLINGRQLREWNLKSDIVDVALPNRGHLVAVTVGSPFVDVYDVATGKRSRQIHHRDAPGFLRKDGQQRICLYPDATKLVSIGGKRRLYLSDVKTGLWDHIIYIKYSTIPKPVVSPNGKRVTLISRPDARELSGHISMFKVRRGLQPLWTRSHDGPSAATFASFSPDSTLLATCGNGDGVRIWKVDAGNLAAHLKAESDERLLGVAFIDNSRLLTASPSGLSVIGIEDGTQHPLVRAPKENQLKGFASSADGTMVVTYTNEAAIVVWNLTT